MEEATLEEQVAAQSRNLPARPLVLGGCCCSHVGAIQGLAARPGRLAVVWLDAHGDLNTPETSPSGNAWGMPLRMAIDAGAVQPQDVALVGARNLDPPEVAYMESVGIDDDVERALEGCDRVYVALDCDVLAAGRARDVHARARRADARRGRRRSCAPRAQPAAGGPRALRAARGADPGASPASPRPPACELRSRRLQPRAGKAGLRWR